MRRESGNGVHLVKYNLLFFCEEQIHPGKTGAAQDPVDFFCGFLDFGGNFLRNPGGDVNPGSGQAVFLCKIKKTAAGEFDFVDRPRPERPVAYNGAAHFKAGDALLHKDLFIILKRLSDCLL